MKKEFEWTSGRVLGPFGVGLVLVVMVVIARGNAADPDVTPTTLDYTSGTSVTLATTTTTSATTTSSKPPTDTPTVTVSTESDAPAWKGLRAGDLGSRERFVATRAGDRIVVWGGIRPAGLGERRGGGSYLARSWTPMATSPIVAGRDPVSVWTGSELFVYSGTAAAWEPEANTWRQLAFPSTGSVSGAFPIAGVWADNQVILVGYRLHPPTREDNLFVTSYGPDLGCCKRYDDPPFSLTYGEAFWTGKEMLLIGALLDQQGERMSDDGLGRMAGLDPSTGMWTEYDPPPLTGSGRISAAWTGTRLIAWHAGEDAAAWTEDAGWRSLSGPPLGGAHCRPRTAAVGEDVFAMLCAHAAVWDASADRWYSISGPRVVNWSSDACIPVADDVDSGFVDVWCSLDQENAFWRIDLSRVEATGYSEPATLSQWELLPNPAATRLDSTAMVWSGEELLYFSGHGIEVEESGGWGYDPRTNTMHRIPDAPYPGRNGQVALWAGDEMLVLRGPVTAWDPAKLTWRTIEGTPPLRAGTRPMWSGTEALFYGDRALTLQAGSALGARYHPAADTWRVIPPAPIPNINGQVVAWSGDEMYIMGGFADDVQKGAAYNPATDSWRVLPPIPSGYSLTAIEGGFVDGEFVVVGWNWMHYSRVDEHENSPILAGFAYSPATDAWRQIPDVPQPSWSGEGVGLSIAATAHNDELAVFLPAEYFGDAASIAFYNPATETWRYVDGAAASAFDPVLVSGDTFVAYLTSAGTVLLHDQ